MKFAPFILLLGVAISLASCGTMQTYEGPQLPSESTAIIQSNFSNPFNFSVVREIDGTELGADQINAEVLPGKHTLKINVNTRAGLRNYMGSKTTTLLANAGHTYKVHGVIKKGETWVWMTDVNTDQVVAGEKYLDVVQSSDESSIDSSLEVVDGMIQAYEGPPLPMEEVAVIEPSFGSVIDSAYVKVIDGKKLGALQIYNKICVIPGEHTVDIYMSTGLGIHQATGKITLSFPAQAGSTYKVHGKIRKGEPWAWIVDEANEDIVAGQAP